jgi:hypothetical protein
VCPFSAMTLKDANRDGKIKLQIEKEIQTNKNLKR